LNEDTKFPDKWDSTIGAFYEPDLVDEWFKRCVKDFPVQGAYFLLEKPFIIWFEKWFRQFKEDDS